MEFWKFVAAILIKLLKLLSPDQGIVGLVFPWKAYVTMFCPKHSAKIETFFKSEFITIAKEHTAIPKNAMTM
jgi:hypothetical protein